MDAGTKDLVDGLDAPIAQVTRRLCEVVAAALPDAIEEPDPAGPLIGYTYKPGTYKHLIAAIAPYTQHVNLMFATGAELTDHDAFGLLEGTGKKARHLTCRTVSDVDRPGIRELLLEAARRTPRA